MAFFEEEHNPAYLPRFMDGTAADWGMRLSHASVDLSHIKWRPGILDPIRGMCRKLIVDPVTCKAFFADSKSKESFKKIGYPDVEPEILYSEKKIRRAFIETSIDQQIEAGADALIAPYLLTSDSDDTKFSTNLTLLSETVLYLKEKNIELPLFAKVCVGLSVLTRQLVINHIYSRYCDDYADSIEGVIIGIDEFDGKTADLGHLLGYANLVHLLQSKTVVVCAPVGGFGEVLIALGATSFGSAIHIGETVSAKQMQKGGGGNENIHQRIYVHEIMGYLNYEEAKTVSYSSNIGGCEIDFSTGNPSSENKNKHYLLSKTASADALKGMTREQKIQFMTERINSARSLVQSYATDHGLPLDDNYLDRWVTVLQKALTWSDPETDERELEELLKELDS